MTPIVQKTAIPIKRPSLKRRVEDFESDDEPRQFRRVRIRCRQRARKQHSQDEVGFEALRSKDEIIRCICGTQDDLELLGNDLDSAHSARTIKTWLIQCCDCKAWQHRSCVGTANENDPPGGFYCGQCSEVKRDQPTGSNALDDAVEPLLPASSYTHSPRGTSDVGYYTHLPHYILLPPSNYTHLPPPLPPPRYIDDIDDITAGSYTGWVSMNEPDGGSGGKGGETVRSKSAFSKS